MYLSVDLLTQTRLLEKTMCITSACELAGCAEKATEFGVSDYYNDESH